MNILDAIGHKPLVRLSRVVPADCAEIWAKLEWENPTGSMKDRMARVVTLLCDTGLKYLSTDVYRRG